MSEAEPLFVLRPSKRSAIGLFAVSAAFVALGLWLVPREGWIGYLCAGFFAIGAVVGALQLIPGSCALIATKEGLTIVNLFRKSTIAWEDIDRFYVVALSARGFTVHRMVGFDFAPSCDRARRGRALASTIAGCEGALPDTYGLSAEQLADLLDRYLAKAKRADLRS